MQSPRVSFQGSGEIFHQSVDPHPVRWWCQRRCSEAEEVLCSCTCSGLCRSPRSDCIWTSPPSGCSIQGPGTGTPRCYNTKQRVTKDPDWHSFISCAGFSTVLIRWNYVLLIYGVFWLRFEQQKKVLVEILHFQMLAHEAGASGFTEKT